MGKVFESKRDKEVRKARRRPAESLHDRHMRRQGAYAKLLETAGSAETHRMAATVPTRTPGDGTPGRPPKHGPWAFVVFGAARSGYGSALGVSVALRDPGVWEAVVKAATPHIGPSAAVMELASGPPTRAQWVYMQDRIVGLGLDEMDEIVHEEAAAQAAEMGLLVAPARTSVLHPDRSTTLAVDGKVHSSPSSRRPGDEILDQVTGEVRPARVDPNMWLWTEGGDDKVKRLGVKSVTVWARHPQAGTRMIVARELLTADPAGGEAAAFVRTIKRAVRLNPGTRTVVCDGALRGVHVAALTPLGLLVVNLINAASSKDDHTITFGDKRFKAKRVFTHTASTEHHGTCNHHVYGAGGGLFEDRTLSNGTHRYTLLPHHLQRVARTGYVDWYIVSNITCPYCGGTRFLVPLNTQSGDAAAGFNRAEYVRQVPEVIPERFDPIYGFRPDAESGNNVTEHTFYLDRIPSYGYERQRLTLLLDMLWTNIGAKLEYKALVRQRGPAAA